MRILPWITIAVTAVAVITPFGRDFLYLAFYSGEQLSRNIAQGVLTIAGAVVLALAAAEVLARWALRRRRARPSR